MIRTASWGRLGWIPQAGEGDYDDHTEIVAVQPQSGQGDLPGNFAANFGGNYVGGNFYRPVTARA